MKSPTIHRGWSIRQSGGYWIATRPGIKEPDFYHLTAQSLLMLTIMIDARMGNAP